MNNCAIIKNIGEYTEFIFDHLLKTILFHWVWGASLRSRLPLSFIVFSSKSAIANILSLHLLTDSQDDVFFKH